MEERAGARRDVVCGCWTLDVGCSMFDVGCSMFCRVKIVAARDEMARSIFSAAEHEAPSHRTSLRSLRQIRHRVCAGGLKVNGQYWSARGDAPAAFARTRYQRPRRTAEP